MAGFTKLDEIINAITTGDFYEQSGVKYGSASEAAGVMLSLWRAEGVPTVGSDGSASSGTPGAGGSAVSNEGITQAWADQSPKTKHLIGMDVLCNQSGSITVYDRLVSVSGVSINSTGTKNVNSVALPRYTDGKGVLAFLEVTTVSTAAAVVSMNSYTNQAGTGGRSGGTVTFPAAATNVNSLIGPMPFQSGDTGIKSVETISVGTSGAGTTTVNVVLAAELARIPLAANISISRDFISQLTTLPRVYDDASLMLVFTGLAAASPVVWYHVKAAFR